MATSLAKLPVSSEGARNEIRQDTQEAEAVEQSEPGLVDAPGDRRRESTGSHSSRPHEDGLTGRPRRIQAVASVAASHPAGTIGGRSGQHYPRHRAFRTAHRFCRVIPLALYSLPSGPRCGVASIHEIRGASSPHNQGDPSPWCVSRETHHAKGAVLRHLPQSSSFATHTPPQPLQPRVPGWSNRNARRFPRFNLYIDITPYL